MDISKEFEFTEGVPSQITASVSCKLSTRQYESVDFFSSVTVTLKEGADVQKAYSDAFRFIEDVVLAPKIKEVRGKYPIGTTR
jgi:hypothetical protein